ncbi:hypothetical protein BH09SUM1_BH09SUM1_06980 [soil metagenome]
MDGAQALHLAIGRPPLVRIAEEGLHPLPGDFADITMKTMQLMLSTAVEPERWDFIEAVGEGEVVLSRAAGRPIVMNLFRNSGAWSAVIRL